MWISKRNQRDHIISREEKVKYCKEIRKWGGGESQVKISRRKLNRRDRETFFFAVIHEAKVAEQVPLSEVLWDLIVFHHTDDVI